MPRPKVPLISRQRTAECALEIIDNEGLEALSLERIAKTLNVRAPSLYHHFADKGEILSEVVRLIMLETPLPDKPSRGDWRDWYLALCVDFRESILRHHRAAPLLLQYYADSLLLPLHERSGKILAEAGIPASIHLLIWDGLHKMTFGSALYAATPRPGYWLWFQDLDAEEWPHVTEGISTAMHSDRELFVESVKVFLDGIEARYVAPRR